MKRIVLFILFVFAITATQSIKADVNEGLNTEITDVQVIKIGSKVILYQKIGYTDVLGIGDDYAIEINRYEFDIQDLLNNPDTIVQLGMAYTALEELCAHNVMFSRNYFRLMLHYHHLDNQLTAQIGIRAAREQENLDLKGSLKTWRIVTFVLILVTILLIVLWLREYASKRIAGAVNKNGFLGALWIISSLFISMMALILSSWALLTDKLDIVGLIYIPLIVCVILSAISMIGTIRILKKST